MTERVHKRFEVVGDRLEVEIGEQVTTIPVGPDTGHLVAAAAWPHLNEEEKAAARLGLSLGLGCGGIIVKDVGEHDNEATRRWLQYAKDPFNWIGKTPYLYGEFLGQTVEVVGQEVRAGVQMLRITPDYKARVRKKRVLSVRKSEVKNRRTRPGRSHENQNV